MSLKILFLCGHNSGRSIAAEAICKKIRPELKASSAGTKPGKRINPEVKKSLQKKGFSAIGSFPKSIDEDHELLNGNIIDSENFILSFFAVH